MKWIAVGNKSTSISKETANKRERGDIYGSCECRRDKCLEN